MAHIEILLPKMGESVAEATIIKWLKSEGDAVVADEAMVEIATDKVDSEVPAPQDGILLKRLVNDGDVVKVGQPIAHIGTAADAKAAPAVSSTAAKAATPSNGSPTPAIVPAVRSTEPVGAPIGKAGPSGKFYSPLVRNIAHSEGVSLAELESLPGSGEGGRVTKKDILDYLPKRGATSPVANLPLVDPVAQSAATVGAKAETQGPKLTPAAGDELLEMDRMRGHHRACSGVEQTHKSTTLPVSLRLMLPTWYSGVRRSRRPLKPGKGRNSPSLRSSSWPWHKPSRRCP